jgi:UDP-N-acetylmuramoylalanine--D-glutamate ligase
MKVTVATMTDVAVKRALVVGLGLTGLSCVRHLRARGYTVRVLDTRPEPPMLARLRAQWPQAEVHAGGWRADWLEDPGLLVVSPGVSLKTPALAQALARGTTAIGDIELFARAARAPVLAVTGTNGKSTVTALAGQMCRAAGLKTAVGGNIGTPALDLLEEAPAPDCYVLELSSFQLETTYSLEPAAAVVLNLTPDHMDRYASLEEYAAAKARIFHGEGRMVLNADDPIVCAMARPGREIAYFGLRPPRRACDYGIVEHAGARWLARGSTRLMPAAEVPLEGRHNLANVLAAMALTEALGVGAEAQCAAVREFRALAHRAECVAEHRGVRYIDDSKGTNVGATVAALSGMDVPVVLIAGGDGKGQDFSALAPAVASRARAVVLIGRDAELIAAALAPTGVPLHRAEDMHAAVRLAARLAQPGDAVLLSPACASFDMFRDYVHRAEVFRQAVREEVLG